MPTTRFTSQGQAATYDDTPAFGQCGELMIELVKVNDVQPASLERAFGSKLGMLHHVSWLVEDREQEEARLAALGIPEVLTIRTDSTSDGFHDATAVLGHYVEIYPNDAESVRSLFRIVREAARDWDGSDPMRPLASAR